MKSIYDPNHITPEFASASAGYLRKPSADLPRLLLNMPEPFTKREKAIYAAVEHGIGRPHVWDAQRRPFVCKRRPGTGLPEWES